MAEIEGGSRAVRTSEGVAAVGPIHQSVTSELSLHRREECDAAAEERGAYRASASERTHLRVLFSCAKLRYSRNPSTAIQAVVQSGEGALDLEADYAKRALCLLLLGPNLGRARERANVLW